MGIMDFYFHDYLIYCSPSILDRLQAETPDQNLSVSDS